MAGGRSAAVARLNTDGSLDTSFDGDGKATPNGADANQYADAVAVTADNRIILGGYDVARNAALFTRLKADGSVDDGFRAG
jgi:hypothetical protein